MVFSNSWILPLKVFFISTGVLSIALFCKTSVPFLMDFSVSRAPVIWSSFLSWLKPPYLYLIINGIIITIVASSRFYQNDNVSTDSSSSSQPPSDKDYEMKEKSDFRSVVYEQQLRDVDVDVDVDLDYETNVKSDFDSVSVVHEQEQPLKLEDIKVPVFEEKSIVVSGDAVEVCYEDATWTPPKRTDSSEILTEYGLAAAKPLVSARFGHRKPVKAGRSSPEGGKALRVTKPKRQDTLENTWKTITEGRAMPLTRHLKKSDTWGNHSRHINRDPSVVKKSETFKDRTNYQLPPVINSPSSGGRLRKEPSLSQDELNRRVEAFIKKFNDEMRLQRQESLRQYQEMIGRGV